MKQRKVISILLTAAMVVTMATGCVKQETVEGETAAVSEKENADADTATDFVLEPVDIKEYGAAPNITDFVPEDADTSGTKEDGTPWKIAWSSLSNAEESLAHMTELMEGMSEEMGFELVTFDAQADPQKQTSDINNAISQGCDALIVAPIDSSSQNSVMKKAKDAGMVVLNVQNTVTDEESYDHYIGPDDTAAAQQAASLLMNALPDGGKIVMVEGNPGETCQINRTKGFKAVISQYPEYELLEEQGCLNWSTAECMSVMESYLSKYPEIDGVFCQWDIGCGTCIQAAEGAGRADDIVFVSVDGTQAGLDAVAEGGCWKGLSMQDFNTNSQIQVLAALASLNGDGDKVEKMLYTPNICITEENAKNFNAGW
ncbi:sugar ABC transporter substrate-binding protein [Lawsonibacter sp. OA9]|uniref:sugar ABC transporter substrate-binding protein n=1 Tax=Oscillospiraceae TaxID=216572 RepID=UPI001F06EC19|nr:MULTISPECIES: sugar ABC transporter substrate-binding protein [Oscillospiraceae]MCH1978291.1 sugar ABC transporter substrate-binding protein [Lawsonibacter sp. OA9]MCH1981443.1 sugar ABC transporter substrate-binding protein [Ruminococcus sp. OA3]